MKRNENFSRVTYVFEEKTHKKVRVVHPTRAEQIANLRRQVHGAPIPVEEQKVDRDTLSRAQEVNLRYMVR